jgi:hypothetical protein
MCITPATEGIKTVIVESYEVHQQPIAKLLRHDEVAQHIANDFS